MESQHGDTTAASSESVELQRKIASKQIEDLVRWWPKEQIFKITGLEDSLTKPIQAFVNEMQKQFEKFELPELVLPTFDFESLCKPVFDGYEKAAAEIQGWIDSMPAQARHDLPILASHGWYMDPEMSPRAAREIAQGFETGNSDDVSSRLVEHFRARASEIGASLSGKYSHRRRFLEKAFDAHKRQEFALSIPVFLAQVDGISYDHTAKLMFQREGKRPQIAAYIEIVADAYQSALLSPLTKIHPISLSSKERSEGFDGLNRHQVMHGESLNYDTEINSLKAISLLNYVAWALRVDSDTVEQGAIT